MTTICVHPDDIVFATLEVILLVLMVYGIAYKLRSKRDNLRLSVHRGNESWQVFYAVWGILSVLITQVISSYQPLQSLKIVGLISVIDSAILYFLCFRSGWFRNKIIGIWGELKDSPED